MNKNIKKSVLVIIYILLTIAGLILMKIGGNTGTISFGEGGFNFSMNFVSLLGFVSYIASFLLFTNIVVKFELSYIMPITAGIIQVLTLLSGCLIFKEKVTINGIIGISLVIIGIVVMNLKTKNKIETVKK